MRQLINQKWYEVPLEQRRRPRNNYTYLGVRTEEPQMRHLLTFEQNQWQGTWTVSCSRGCGLSKPFADQEAAHIYGDKVWDHECAGIVIQTLDCLLLSKV